MSRVTITEAYRAAAAAKRRECDANRALLLRYPDIAARLTDVPYKASDPRNWTGYIPGPLAGENSRGVVSLNTSPVRAQLMTLLEEAAERSDAEQRAREQTPATAATQHRPDTTEGT